MNPTRVTATLEALDQMEADTVLLFLAEDERPPRGVPGLVDWRLAGTLSRLAARGWLGGQAGDLTLSPGRARLAGARLLLCGVGEGAKATEMILQQAVSQACEVLPSLATRHLACGLPGFGKDPVGLSVSVERSLATRWSGPLVLLEPER